MARERRQSQHRPWLFWTILVVAIVVVVGAIIYTVATGQKFF
ncbi:hypothetical protein [Frondihabitans sp. PAMC 28766]|nr:hypothetical protein [Frondihabitans sp. PAMC 28766]